MSQILCTFQICVIIKPANYGYVGRKRKTCIRLQITYFTNVEGFVRTKGFLSPVWVPPQIQDSLR
jgi:hypothetical protein